MHPEGVEPPTLGSEDRCSVQLSYGCGEGNYTVRVRILFMNCRMILSAARHWKRLKTNPKW
jgi:hypothetical protein